MSCAPWSRRGSGGNAETKSGSCRNSGWLLVQILRHLGSAARFVSGYYVQLKPDIAALDSLRRRPPVLPICMPGRRSISGAGWIGLDPTSGLLCGEGHLPWRRRRVPLRRADQRIG